MPRIGYLDESYRSERSGIYVIAVALVAEDDGLVRHRLKQLRKGHGRIHLRKESADRRQMLLVEVAELPFSAVVAWR